MARPEGIARVWLDGDTFGLQSNDVARAAIDGVSAADLQRVATRLFKDIPIASIVVGDAKQLQAALEPNTKIEMMGEVESETRQTGHETRNDDSD